ncbi:hypothetical protein [Oceanobacter mangrovi]|uniref:hypothetical protein n=1 Tax=Oceanobacter mangrovi TaxID=2862510 RepID=UPI001C8D25E4|nr:hypothetical protein [Oceanobacter mangrovi]
MKSSMIKVTLVGASLVLLAACAQLKETGATIGEGTKDVATSIGHASRDIVKSIGKNTKEVVDDVKDGSDN